MSTAIGKPADRVDGRMKVTGQAQSSAFALLRPPLDLEHRLVLPRLDGELQPGGLELLEAQEAQLQVQAEQLRSSLLSSVSHDLRTPLATIAGASSSLLDETPNKDERCGA